MLSDSFLGFARAGPNQPLPGAGEFDAIRRQWSHAPYVQPYWEVAKTRTDLFSSYHAGDSDAVLAGSRAWLEKFPIDAPVHWMRAQAFKAKGDYDGYSRHLYWYRGLIDSLHRSGNGRTPATAVTVVALREEYFYVQDLGGRVIAQDLIEVGGVALHKVRAEFEGGRARTLYFDISVPIHQLERNTFPAPGRSAREGANPARVTEPIPPH